MNREELKDIIYEFQKGWNCWESPVDKLADLILSELAKEKTAPAGLVEELEACLSGDNDYFMHLNGEAMKNRAFIPKKMLEEILSRYARPVKAPADEGLVEALEKLSRLGNGDEYGNSDGNRIAQEALARYKASDKGVK